MCWSILFMGASQKTIDMFVESLWSNEVILSDFYRLHIRTIKKQRPSERRFSLLNLKLFRITVTELKLC